MPNTLNSPNISFKARCPQVRDADWVCHRINHVFPHFSITKFNGLATNLYKSTKLPVLSKSPNIDDGMDLYMSLRREILTEEDLSRCSLPKKFIYNLISRFHSEKHKQNLKILAKIREAYRNFFKLRSDFMEKHTKLQPRAYLHLKAKNANCAYTAAMAGCVLKLNGVKNPNLLFLVNAKNSREIDHVVCAFNIDGSIVDKVNPRKTIIVDAWANKADFAENMSRYHRDSCRGSLLVDDSVKIAYVADSSKMDFSPEIFGITEADLNALRFTNKNRKFMQTKQ